MIDAYRIEKEAGGLEVLVQATSQAQSVPRRANSFHVCAIGDDVLHKDLSSQLVSPALLCLIW